MRKRAKILLLGHLFPPPCLTPKHIIRGNISPVSIINHCLQSKDSQTNCLSGRSAYSVCRALNAQIWGRCRGEVTPAVCLVHEHRRVAWDSAWVGQHERQATQTEQAPPKRSPQKKQSENQTRRHIQTHKDCYCTETLICSNLENAQ